MIVLFVLGLFGFKAALAVYVVFKIAQAVTRKGDKIKKGYEAEISRLKKENARIRFSVFPQRGGNA